MSRIIPPAARFRQHFRFHLLAAVEAETVHAHAHFRVMNGVKGTVGTADWREVGQRGRAEQDRTPVI